jgi:hypothetical protein
MGVDEVFCELGALPVFGIGESPEAWVVTPCAWSWISPAGGFSVCCRQRFSSHKESRAVKVPTDLLKKLKRRPEESPEKAWDQALAGIAALTDYQP